MAAPPEPVVEVKDSFEKIQEAQREYPWLKLTNLVSEKVGGQVLYVTDEFFAPGSWLLKEGRGRFFPGKFVETGQYMEGWETRRHNPDHDWAIIRLGISGVIAGVDIDTLHFTGNYAEYASLDAVCFDKEPTLEELKNAKWVEILPKSQLQAGTLDKGHNYFNIQSKQRWTHLRLHNYPDGGIARLKVHGHASPNWSLYEEDEVLNLSAIEKGASIADCSNAFYSHPENLLMPHKGINMGDGWETRRRRGPGYDWVIVKLGWAGLLSRIIVDTAHFRGNFPDSCTLEGCNLPEGASLADAKWIELLPKTKLSAHSEHLFKDELLSKGPFTHIRLNVFPDGGVSRLRVFGRRVQSAKL